MANPRVGVGVFVFRNSGEFVIGERIGSHGANTLALPGGHLEFGETFAECAVREVKEETGLDVENVHFLTATNDIFQTEGKHYVTIFVGCRVRDGNAEPEVLEPEKCKHWEWLDWEALVEEFSEKKEPTEAVNEASEKRKLFVPIHSLLSTRKGFQPWEEYWRSDELQYAS